MDFACTKFVFIALLATVKTHNIMQEPIYKNLVYGGVWKHITQRPSEDSEKMVQVKQFIHVVLDHHYPKDSASDIQIEWLTKMDLWYSSSSLVPFSIQMQPRHDTQSDNHVSVPLSIGETYNFKVLLVNNSTKFTHFMTVTESYEFESLFLYSHIFYSDNSLSNAGIYFLAEIDSKVIGNSPILCSLAANKNLQRLKSSSSCKEAIDRQSNPSLCEDPQLEQPPHAHMQEDKECERPSSSSKRSNPSMTIDNFSIMTYNTWNYFTSTGHPQDYKERIMKLTNLVREHQPDVIGFQEVRFEAPQGGDLGPSQMDHITSRLAGYQFVYQPAMMHETSLQQGRTEEGVAIFSRYPIIHHDYILLHRNISHAGDGHQRVCLHAVILMPSVGPIHVFNTHWSLTHEAREKAAAQITEYMGRYSGPAFLLGDLNASPEEKSIIMLTKTSNLRDAWPSIQPDSDGFTFSCLDSQPSKRIDFIFYRQNSNISVKDIFVVPDGIRHDAASDHRPVMAMFSSLNLQ